MCNSKRSSIGLQKYLKNYVKEHNFKSNCRQKAKEYRTNARTFQRSVRPSTIEGIAADEIRNGLNELFINGEIEVGDTLNDKWIRIL